MSPDTDQLGKQLKQEGFVIFQLLSPEEVAGLNRLVRGIVCKCDTHAWRLIFLLPALQVPNHLRNNILLYRP